MVSPERQAAAGGSYPGSTKHSMPERSAVRPASEAGRGSTRGTGTVRSAGDGAGKTASIPPGPSSAGSPSSRGRKSNGLPSSSTFTPATAMAGTRAGSSGPETCASSCAPQARLPSGPPLPRRRMALQRLRPPRRRPSSGTPPAHRRARRPPQATRTHGLPARETRSPAALGRRAARPPARKRSRRARPGKGTRPGARPAPPRRRKQRRPRRRRPKRLPRPRRCARKEGSRIRCSTSPRLCFRNGSLDSSCRQLSRVVVPRPL